MQQTKQLPTHLSIDEGAKVTSVSTKTIRRRISDGTIPAYQCGRGPSESAWKTSRRPCAASRPHGGEAWPLTTEAKSEPPLICCLRRSEAVMELVGDTGFEPERIHLALLRREPLF